jgi:hypothetical protein
MLVIENDWIEYEETVARRQAVRGGAACDARFPAASLRTAPQLRLVPPPVVPVRVTEASAGRRRSTLRLTRRGRVVLVVLPALALLSGTLVTSTARVAEAAPVPLPAVQVTVRADDSLWSIAERVAPQRDPRDVVAALEAANGIGDATVQQGQRLVVPAAVLSR